MMLSSAQRCSEKRRVMAAPSASANARPAAVASAVPAAADEMKLRRFMRLLPVCLSRYYTARACPGKVVTGFPQRTCTKLIGGTPEHEVIRDATLAFRLRLIAGRHVAGPGLAPVGGAFGGPDERRCAQEALQRP